MFHSKAIFSLAALGIAFASVAAQAGDDEFFFGAGAGVADLSKPAAMAVIKMQLNDLHNKAYDINGAGPKMDVEIGIGSDGVLPTVPHADFTATLVRVGNGDFSADDHTRGGFEGLTINYQREVAVDLDHTITVSLAGAWVDSRVEITPKVKLMVAALIDIASMGYVKRLGAKPGELDNVFGWTPNASLEVGLEVLDRFRIVLAEKAIFALGVTTDKAFDNGNDKGLVNSVQSRTSATASFDITKHFSMFFEGSYALYAFNGRPDPTHTILGGTVQGDDVHVEKGVWQLIAGVGGKF